MPACKSAVDPPPKKTGNRSVEAARTGSKPTPPSQKEEAHLVEEVDVRLALHLAHGLVLRQRAAAQLLVGRDDVEALLHPLEVEGGGAVAGGAVDDGPGVGGWGGRGGMRESRWSQPLITRDEDVCEPGQRPQPKPRLAPKPKPAAHQAGAPVRDVAPRERVPKRLQVRRLRARLQLLAPVGEVHAALRQHHVGGARDAQHADVDVELVAQLLGLLVLWW